MSTTVIKRGPGGSFAVDAEDERQRQLERLNEPLPRPRKPGAPLGFRRVREIRQYYARAIASRIKSFGPTSFDVGGGMDDQEAFDACVENFGFKHSVEALKPVSVRAKACAASQARRAS